MKNKQWLVGFLLLFTFLSCKHYPAVYQTETTEISDNLPDAQPIDHFIQPYRDSLEQEIYKVIGYFGVDMHKALPESELGNFMTDACFEFYNGLFSGHQSADFAITNYGGIRTNLIEAGEVTVAQMFEVMPFENELVYMELSGNTILEIGKVIAEKGGMPISKNVNIIIDNKQIKEFLVDGEPIDKNKTYKVLMNDYMAQGGDNLDMLKGRKFTSTDSKIRDILIDYCQWKYDNNEQITAPITGRIIIVE